MTSDELLELLFATRNSLMRIGAGEEGSRPRSEPELLSLTDPGNYSDAGSWCVTNITTDLMDQEEVFSSWDGATGAMVDSLEFSRTTEMTVHHQDLFQAVLICGGADAEYQVEKLSRGTYSEISRTGNPKLFEAIFRVHGVEKPWRDLRDFWKLIHIKKPDNVNGAFYQSMNKTNMGEGLGQSLMDCIPF